MLENLSKDGQGKRDNGGISVDCFVFRKSNFEYPKSNRIEIFLYER